MSSVIFLRFSSLKFICEFSFECSVGGRCGDSWKAGKGQKTVQFFSRKIGRTSDSVKEKTACKFSERPDIEWVRLRFLINGRVQGVSFRYHAQRCAWDLGLRGWIRNLPSGDVEGMVEGEPSGVTAFLAWCRQGPPGARVDRVETHDEDGEPLSSFQIVR